MSLAIPTIIVRTRGTWFAGNGLEYPASLASSGSSTYSTYST